MTEEEIKKEAEKAKPALLAYYKKNKKLLAKSDEKVHSLHYKYMGQMDCLSCANCCKNLGPALYDRDIDKIAKALKLKPSEVVEQYLRQDEDGDYVFKSMPCPFLMPDNYCMIYENRPKACREYPHTDRKKFYQLYLLSVKNSFTCPVVLQVLKDLTQ